MPGACEYQYNEHINDEVDRELTIFAVRLAAIVTMVSGEQK